MSDLHSLPLRGHDLPEITPAPVRRRAHVWLCRHALLRGWWWEHQCAKSFWADSGPFASLGDACDDAVQHLKRGCR